MTDGMDVWREAKEEFLVVCRLARLYRKRLEQIVEELAPEQQAALQEEWDRRPFTDKEREVLQWLE